MSQTEQSACVTFTRRADGFSHPMAALYRSSTPYCTAVFRTVPPNQKILLSQHLRHSVPPGRSRREEAFSLSFRTNTFSLHKNTFNPGLPKPIVGHLSQREVHPMRTQHVADPGSQNHIPVPKSTIDNRPRFAKRSSSEGHPICGGPGRSKSKIRPFTIFTPKNFLRALPLSEDHPERFSEESRLFSRKYLISSHFFAAKHDPSPAWCFACYSAVMRRITPAPAGYSTSTRFPGASPTASTLAKLPVDEVIMTHWEPSSG